MTTLTAPADPVTVSRPADDPDAARSAAALRRWARVVLVPVALIGAALSFANIYDAALPTFGPVLAAGVPFLVDFLILGASLMYIGGAKVGRPRPGWRLTAHAGVVGTLVLNAMASPDLQHLPWHVVAPAVWSVLVEMTAREVLGEWRATHTAPADRIPVRLWLTAPVESARTWLLMARVGALSHRTARVDVGVMAAANEALRLALPGRRPRRVRHIIRRQLRAGSLPPADVLAALGWTGANSTALVTDPALVLRATLHGVLAPEATATGDALAALIAAPAPVAELPAQAASDVAAVQQAAEQARAERDQAQADLDATRVQLEESRARADEVTADLELMRTSATAADHEQTRLRAEADQARQRADDAERTAAQLQADAEQWADLLDRASFAVLDIARRLAAGERVTGAQVAAECRVTDRTGRRYIELAEQLVAQSRQGQPTPGLSTTIEGEL